MCEFGVCVCEYGVCVCVSMMCMGGVHKGQKRASVLQELELQAGVSRLHWDSNCGPLEEQNVLLTIPRAQMLAESG